MRFELRVYAKLIVLLEFYYHSIYLIVCIKKYLLEVMYNVRKELFSFILVNLVDVTKLRFNFILVYALKIKGRVVVDIDFIISIDFVIRPSSITDIDFIINSELEIFILRLIIDFTTSMKSMEIMTDIVDERTGLDFSIIHYYLKNVG